jgi:ATP-binding cassette, subfamily G (WHITE), member 2, SNQ2
MFRLSECVPRLPRKLSQRPCRFRQAVKDTKGRFVSKKSPYTASFFTQVRALARRQVQLKLQDWFSIFTSYSTSISKCFCSHELYPPIECLPTPVIALIVGSLYLNLPETASGAFTRGGVLFIGLLFNSLNAFSELPSQVKYCLQRTQQLRRLLSPQMQGRAILYKQVNFLFYRPSAVSFAGMLADIPFTSIQILVRLLCVSFSLLF